MKADEKLHIAMVGEAKFKSAYGKAMLCIKQDARLTGLDKIRMAIAEEAAFRATGYEKRPLNLPRGCGKVVDDGGNKNEIQSICEQILERASEAAQS